MTEERAALLEEFIAAMKASGVWEKLDYFVVYDEGQPLVLKTWRAVGAV